MKCGGEWVGEGTGTSEVVNVTVCPLPGAGLRHCCGALGQHPEEEITQLCVSHHLPWLQRLQLLHPVGQ